jgi:hypothetical protein
MGKLKHRVLTVPRSKKEKRKARQDGVKPKGVEKVPKKTKNKNKDQKVRVMEPTIPFDVYDDILLVGEGTSLCPANPAKSLRLYIWRVCDTDEDTKATSPSQHRS